jgi:aspartate racemase
LGQNAQTMSNSNDFEQELTLGVLGGMGPQATADFLAKLVQVTPAEREQDHLHVLVDSNPKVPDRNQAIAGRGSSPAPVLAEMAQRLERAGAGLLVMACNTAHAFEAAIRAAVSIPFVSIVEEACDACLREAPAAKTIGLLAAPGCIQAGLYQSALVARGLQPLLPEDADQAVFNRLLYEIKLGASLADIRPEMRRLALGLTARGADVLMAACTEVPLVLGQADVDRPLIDATHNLAVRCVRYARGIEPLPGTSSSAS